MFRYKLRTLLILLAIGPPLLAGAWFAIVSNISSRKVEAAPLITHFEVCGSTMTISCHFGTTEDADESD